MQMTQPELDKWEKICEEIQMALTVLTQDVGTALKVGGMPSEETMCRWDDLLRREKEFREEHGWL